jgi:hypothetical protein
MRRGGIGMRYFVLCRNLTTDIAQITLRFYIREVVLILNGRDAVRMPHLIRTTYRLAYAPRAVQNALIDIFKKHNLTDSTLTGEWERGQKLESSLVQYR